HVVMFINVRTELDLFDLVDGVLLLLLVLREFVAEFSVVDDAADGRLGGCCDFDEVESVTLRLANGILGAHDTKLFAGGGNDDANFAGADAVVDSMIGFAGAAPLKWASG